MKNNETLKIVINQLVKLEKEKKIKFENIVEVYNNDVVVDEDIDVLFVCNMKDNDDYCRLIICIENEKLTCYIDNDDDCDIIDVCELK